VPNDPIAGKLQLETLGSGGAKRSGHKKAVVGIARRLSVIMLVVLRDGTLFDPGNPEPAARAPKSTSPRHDEGKVTSRPKRAVV
jgi:hypothetical protein